jgi:hypothetical protein
VTNPNDPQHPSPFDGDDPFPFRHVALFCDYECDTPDFTADVRADTREQAFAALRRLAAEAGWRVGRLDVCPACAAAADTGEVGGG